MDSKSVLLVFLSLPPRHVSLTTSRSGPSHGHGHHHIREKILTRRTFQREQWRILRKAQSSLPEPVVEPVQQHLISFSLSIYNSLCYIYIYMYVCVLVVRLGAFCFVFQGCGPRFKRLDVDQHIVIMICFSFHCCENQFLCYRNMDQTDTFF